MRDLIKKILLQEISINIDRDDYNWRKSVTTGPKGDEIFKRDQIRTFKIDNQKYVVNTEEYEEDYYLVAFYPKLPDSWHEKQQRLKIKGEPYHDKYSVTSNVEDGGVKSLKGHEFKVFGLLVQHLQEILKENPLASFGYVGAPNKHTGDSNRDLYDTKRANIYAKMLDDHFSNTHYPTFSNKSVSGGMLVNKEKTKEIPKEELLNYGMHILTSHIH